MFVAAAQRFEDARQVVHAQALRFGYPPDGPLADAGRLAPSGDWMRGPFSEAVRATVASMLRYLAHLAEEWEGLAGALNRAVTESEAAARMQAVGLSPAVTDPADCLRAFRSWEPAPWRLDPAWAQVHGSGGRLFLTPDLTRRLAGYLRDGSEGFEAERRRFAQTLGPLGVNVPHALTLLADAAWEVAEAVIGSMMLDMAEAQHLLQRSPKARSDNPAVQAWIAFARLRTGPRPGF